MLTLLSQYGNLFKTNDLWFNGWQHLNEGTLETFSPVQGEKVTDLILSKGIPWNRAFGNKAVVTSEDNKAIEFGDKLKLTVLSPSVSDLAELIPVWKQACSNAGIEPAERTEEPLTTGLEVFGGNIDSWAAEPFKSDGSPTNGSSIALLAEYRGKRLFLAGDAHAERLTESFGRLSDEQKKIDGFKLPHHGSKANLSPKLLEAFECDNFLISTNGVKFKHPDKEAIARIIKSTQNAKLVFNYCSEFTIKWDNPNWKQKYNYSVQYLDKDSNFSPVELLS